MEIWRLCTFACQIVSTNINCTIVGQVATEQPVGLAYVGQYMQWKNWDLFCVISKFIILRNLEKFDFFSLLLPA